RLHPPLGERLRCPLLCADVLEHESANAFTAVSCRRSSRLSKRAFSRPIRSSSSPSNTVDERTNKIARSNQNDLDETLEGKRAVPQTRWALLQAGLRSRPVLTPWDADLNPSTWTRGHRSAAEHTRISYLCNLERRSPSPNVRPLLAQWRFSAINCAGRCSDQNSDWNSCQRSGVHH